MKKQGIGILAILLVIGLAVAVSGCTSSTPDQTNVSTPAPSQDTSTQSTPTQSTHEAADVSPVDGSIGTYVETVDGYPGYESADGSYIWMCDKKDHIKMYGYMADYEANGNQWKDSDLTTVAWN